MASPPMPPMPVESSWRAPGRVNLIGEHTDYNDGFCLPLAIPYGCTATVSPLSEPVLEVVSAQQEAPVEIALAELRPGRLTGADAWAGYAAGVAWAIAERGHRLPGLSISLDGDVPLGAGLSSSAALECSVAAALDDQLALGLDRSELVALARQAENDFVGAPTGGMDQLASVFAERDRVLLCDMRTLAVEPVPFDLDAAGLSLLVIDTRAPHQLTDGSYGERRAACEEAARLLGVPALRDVDLEGLPEALDRLPDETLRKRARHVITENDRTLACADLLRTGQLRRIGPLLTASHESMRDDFEITVPEVDLAVEVLLAFGAAGARMTGGGFGGCVIALMEPAQARAGALAVQAAFAGRGYAEPVGFPVTAAAGVHRLG
ncbi:galactokinase [Jatrophihabitans sp.]|uniref:galactokinase n=1 Tax=Jatrophihabitans sp. TaxID=1932789 RepID=UPI002C368E75|nr:galactokinase [Jatrophihabitans sp.]